MQNKPRVVALVSVAFLALAVAARGQEQRPASVRVMLPAANARLIIDDQPTRQTGPTRSFESPPLKAGTTYFYTLTATWEPNNYTTITRTRKVVVHAGERVQADLRPADPHQPDKIVIRYVPTPNEVVDAMLRL